MYFLRMSRFSFVLGLVVVSAFICLSARAAFTVINADSTAGSGAYGSSIIVSGNPGIAYWSGSQLRYARGIDSGGTSFFAPIALDSTSTSGQTNLQIVDGNPAVCYRDSTSKRLKFVRALDVFGAGWNTAVLVSGAT